MTGFLVAAIILGQQSDGIECPRTLLDALEKSKLTYATLPAFLSFKYTIAESKRTQTVYLRKASEEYLGLKVNEVFGIVWDEPQKPSRDLLLSTFNKRFTIGGLVLELPSATQKNYRIRFRTTVSATASPREVKDVLNVVASTADDLEKQLNPGKGDLQ